MLLRIIIISCCLQVLTWGKWLTSDMMWVFMSSWCDIVTFIVFRRAMGSDQIIHILAKTPPRNSLNLNIKQNENKYTTSGATTKISFLKIEGIKANTCSNVGIDSHKIREVRVITVSFLSRDLREAWWWRLSSGSVIQSLGAFQKI